MGSFIDSLRGAERQNKTQATRPRSGTKNSAGTNRIVVPEVSRVVLQEHMVNKEIYEPMILLPKQEDTSKQVRHAKEQTQNQRRLSEYGFNRTEKSIEKTEIKV